MTVFAISMVRDEADIIETTLRHTLCHVDHIIVADNLSSDGTRLILDRLAEESGRITVVDDPEPGYYQSEKMTALADQARAAGATWAVPVDADEIWTAGPGRISEVLEAQPHSVDCVAADFFHHCSTHLDDETVTDVVQRWGWRTGQSAILKVAVRLAAGLVIAQGNHGATYFGAPGRHAQGLKLVVHHYPYRSPEQVRSKVLKGAEAYEAADGLPAEFGFHWKQMAEAIRDDPEAAADIFWRFHRNDDPSTDMIFDPAPLRRWER